jgi:hypothetical protein
VSGFTPAANKPAQFGHQQAEMSHFLYFYSNLPCVCESGTLAHPDLGPAETFVCGLIEDVDCEGK